MIKQHRIFYHVVAFAMMIYHDDLRNPFKQSRRGNQIRNVSIDDDEERLQRSRDFQVVHLHEKIFVERTFVFAKLFCDFSDTLRVVAQNYMNRFFQMPRHDGDTDSRTERVEVLA